MVESSGPSVFVLTGPIAQVDLAARRLLIGLHVLEVIPAVRLPAFRVGDRVIVNGVRDPRTGREIAIEVVDPNRRIAPIQPKNAIERPRTATILSLVVSLLLELHLEARLLECELLPANNQYAIRLEIPGEVGKAVMIPRAVVERAPGDPNARRQVRAFLRAAIETLRSQRALSDARTLMAATRDPHPAESNSSCLRCHGPFSAGDPVFVIDRGRVHLACPPGL